MARVFNFSAGPATLPESVLQKASSEMLDYNNSGMSVMEMSHRSSVYTDIFYKAEADFRTLMNVPENYEVLFLQGGASTQFAMIPLNIATGTKKIDFVNTGVWSKKAMKEAKKVGDVTVVASSEDKTFNYIPKLTADMFTKDADYVHIVSNNTIYGTRYTTMPDTGDVPLVADMSSNILSEPVDVSKFGIIFAGAQKNIGPAGVTVVVVRKDLVGKADDSLLSMLNYTTHVEAKSMFNTPPTYAAYIAGLVFEELLAGGGVEAMKTRNEEKAALLYDFLDNSKMFKGTAAVEDRSLMNVPFVTDSDELNAKFIKEATEKGLVNLKGHRSVGGMRASIYNAMPKAGVVTLIDFMKEFETNN